MKVKFWGTRGSIPCSTSRDEDFQRILHILEYAEEHPDLLQEGANKVYDKLPGYLQRTIGGNTSCVEVTSGRNRIILDAGTGIRNLGNALVGKESICSDGMNIHLLFSHTHWDHINGLPFFIPLYLAQSNVHIYGGHENLEKRFRLQHNHYNFPVDFDELKSNITFHTLKVGETTTINDFQVQLIRQYHPGGSYGYRIEKEGKVLAYSTDAEYQDESDEGIAQIVDLAKDADMLIFDAMYSFNETIEKVDWGHSSSRMGVKIAHQAGVKKLALFHHDPEHNNFNLDKIYKETLSLRNHLLGNESKLNIINSYDDLEVSL